MLHGHTHNAQEHYEEVRFAKELNAKDIPCHAYNVGCMHWNYEPVTLEEIMLIISQVVGDIHYVIKDNKCYITN